jgi:RNA polymerase sigma-70 factor (ECF subfamily)
MIAAHNGVALATRKEDRRSGDWLGIVEDGPRVRLALADVQGKGEGAAPYHAHLDRQMRASRRASLVDLLAALHEGWPGSRFASLGLLEIDTARHQFTAAAAGHPDPLVRAPGGLVRRLPASRYGLLGVNLDADETSLPSQGFLPGAAVLLYSDGVVDAGIRRGQPFGEARLRNCLQEAESPAAAVENVRCRLVQHLDGRPLEDDASLVIVWRSAAAPVAQAAAANGAGLPCTAPLEAGGDAALACPPAGKAPEETAEPDAWTRLLLRAQAGDGAALDLLLTETAARLFPYLLALLHNGEDARDVIQETALRVQKCLLAFDAGRGTARSWITTIARRLALDLLIRGPNRRKAVRLGAGGIDVPGDREDPALVAEASEDRDELRRALAVLQPEQREAILLRYYGKLSYKEMSETLQVPVGTIATRIHRAIEELRRHLGPRFGLPRPGGMRGLPPVRKPRKTA